MISRTCKRSSIVDVGIRVSARAWCCRRSLIGAARTLATDPDETRRAVCDVGTSHEPPRSGSRYFPLYIRHLRAILGSAAVAIALHLRGARCPAIRLPPSDMQ